MKILIINYEFPPIGGGAGNASYHIARELTHLDHSVCVVTSRYHGLADREEVHGFEVIRIPAKRTYVDACSIFEMATFLASGLWYIPAIVRDFHPDMTLAFFTIPCAPIAWFVKFRFGIPYVTLLRGGDVPGFKGIGFLASFMHVLLKPLTRFLWSHSRAVVANSFGLAELARKTWPRPIAIVPNGVDTDFFKPSDSPRVRDGTLRMLFVGRFTAQKGLPVFLRTLAEMKAVSPWRLTLVGDGPERTFLNSIIKASPALDGRVHLTGWLKKSELIGKYHESDVFVFPSIDEGMPNAMLEAMACGLPILATDIAGNEELVRHGENGYLYPPGDNEKLRVYLLRLFDERAALNAIGKQSLIASRKFGWHETAIQISKLAEKI